VARFLSDHPQVAGQVALKCLGIPDVFIQHASRKEQLEEAGLSPAAVRAQVLALLASSEVESFGPGRASGD
jgi:deoxyxylulose-5-phosphate synthase